MIKYLGLSAALFAIGTYGVLARRNLIIVLMSIELMLNAANLAIVTFSRYHTNSDGQVFFLMVMGVAAAEVAVGLSIVVALFRNKKSVDTANVSELKG